MHAASRGHAHGYRACIVDDLPKRTKYNHAVQRSQVPLPDEEARFDILCVKAAALERDIKHADVSANTEYELAKQRGKGATSALPQAFVPSAWLNGSSLTTLNALERAELCAEGGLDGVWPMHFPVQVTQGAWCCCIAC